MNKDTETVDSYDSEAADQRSASKVTQEKRTLGQMDLFLQGYSAGGTVRAGLKCCTVTRRTVARWKEMDMLGFRSRYKEAHRDFCDWLEDKAQELVEGLKPGQNSLLLVTLLNANMPDKYRPNAIMVDDTAKVLIDKLKKLAAPTSPRGSARGSTRAGAGEGERSGVGDGGSEPAVSQAERVLKEAAGSG